MNLLEAYQHLATLAPSFTTKEAGEVLHITPNHASSVLSHLEKKNSITRLKRGLWAYSDTLDPLLLPSILTQPMMAYVSLYTALYYHGLIDQIPSVIFSVTNAKTKRYTTPLGTVSMHSISPHLFTGFELYGEDDIMMATPEKALFDMCYFIPMKSHQFKRLTEVTIPDTFDWALIDTWVELIEHPGRKQLTKSHLATLKNQ